MAVTAYVDYTYYTTHFLGAAIASTDFPRLALRATYEVNKMAFQRAAGIIAANNDTASIDLIKMATCAVAEQIQTNDNAGNSDGIQSESVGNASVTYADNSNARLTNDAKLLNAAMPYLSSTGLLFRGLKAGEHAHER